MASQLFDENIDVGGIIQKQLEVDREVRKRLVARVLNEWRNWHEKTGGTPEQYLCHLKESPRKERWRDAQWYVALNITLQSPGVQISSSRKEILYHSLEHDCLVDEHKLFWDAIFQITENVSVVTTNYDLLAEQGLRSTPTPYANRHGFHYGNGLERLEGGVSGNFPDKKAIEIRGRIPLLKIHGSNSWTNEGHGLVRFHDCRPAKNGTAAIIAPSTEKSIPLEFKKIWRKAELSLSEASKWIIVGYSFPEYDHAINDLMKRSAEHCPRIHILNPDKTVATRVKQLLPKAKIHRHTGLPGALSEIPSMLS